MGWSNGERTFSEGIGGFYSEMKETVSGKKSIDERISLL